MKNKEMSEDSDLTFIQALCLVGQQKGQEQGKAWEDALVNLFPGQHRDMTHWNEPDFMRPILPFYIDDGDSIAREETLAFMDAPRFENDVIITTAEFDYRDRAFTEHGRSSQSSMLSVATSQIKLCHDAYWKLIAYLKESKHYTLQSIDNNNKPPRINPFNQKDFGILYSLNAHDSIISTKNASYALTCDFH